MGSDVQEDLCLNDHTLGLEPLPTRFTGRESRNWRCQSPEIGGFTAMRPSLANTELQGRVKMLGMSGVEA